MKTPLVGLEEGRSTLPRLAAQAHAGQCSVLTRHGKPYAAIVPVDLLRQSRRRASLLALKGTGAGLWATAGAGLVATLRDEWG